MKTVEEQLRIIKKGVDHVIGEDELRGKIERSIKEDRPLTFKFGLDPSSADIHLGHTVPLRKLKQVQDLGHKVVIIIGDFTGKIGDPTGKSKGRNQLSYEQVMENAKTYEKQIRKVLDAEKTTICYNSEWLRRLNLEDVIQLATTTTVARMLERDEFAKRFQKNEAIGLHEFFYPLMQAYDSVAIRADVELGGTDQTFNILAGRSLQKFYGQESQAAIFFPILEGLDGVEKMSKSLGNYIGIDEPAHIMFKKVMEIPDHLIIRYFELVTDEYPDHIAHLKNLLESGENPRDIKLLLAESITKLYHGEEKMKDARRYYDQAFAKKSTPDEMPELLLTKTKSSLLDIVKDLIDQHLIASGSELRRLVTQGGVFVNGERLLSVDYIFVEEATILKIGKKKFVKVIKES